MEAALLATAALILLAITALILWRIERHLRPETYVLMREEVGRLVPAEFLRAAYTSERAAWKAARCLREDEGGTVYIIEKKRDALVGYVADAPEEPWYPCADCGEEQPTSELYPSRRGVEPGRLYETRVCRSCLDKKRS